MLHEDTSLLNSLSKILKINTTFNKIKKSPASRPTRRLEPKNLNTSPK